MTAGYLVLQANRGRSLSASQVQEAIESAERYFGFVKVIRSEWRSPSGNTLLVWWSFAANRLPRDRIALFTGYVRIGSKAWLPGEIDDFSNHFFSLSVRPHLDLGGVF